MRPTLAFAILAASLISSRPAQAEEWLFCAAAGCESRLVWGSDGTKTFFQLFVRNLSDRSGYLRDPLIVEAKRDGLLSLPISEFPDQGVVGSVQLIDSRGPEGPALNGLEGIFNDEINMILWEASGRFAQGVYPCAGPAEGLVDVNDNPVEVFYRTCLEEGLTGWVWASWVASDPNAHPDDFIFAGDFPMPTAAVPEPGTVILLGTGLFGLSAVSWQRRKRSS